MKSFLKLIIKAVSAFFVLLFLSIVILYFVFTPLVEVDERNAQVKLLGGHIVLDNSDSFSFSFHSSSSGGQGNMSENGQIPFQSYSRLIIKGKNGSLSLEGVDATSLRFNCSSSSRLNYWENQLDNKEFIFDLGGKGDCYIFVPKEVKVLGNMNDGKIALKNLNQDFSIELKNGTIIWNQENPQKYSLTLETSSGDIHGDLDKFSKEKSSFKADIKLKNGSIFINP